MNSYFGYNTRRSINYINEKGNVYVLHEVGTICTVTVSHFFKQEASPQNVDGLDM